VISVRKSLIAGNWKMYKTTKEARDYIHELRNADWDVDREVAVLAPFTCLTVFHEAREWSRVQYGAQNMSWEKEGAFTGEISPLMLLELGCKYVLVGHSERRQVMGESEEMINSKIKRALECGLVPIFCVGETLEEREKGQAEKRVAEQIRLGLQGVSSGHDLVVAYEPVWAIGTGLNAKATDAQEMCSFIRQALGRMYDQKWAGLVRILYGGSVKPDNAGEFMSQDDIDGALVGGASLDPAVFRSIVNY